MTVRESTLFMVNDRLVDAWGNEQNGETEDTELGYGDWTGKQLLAEISRRNEDREDDDQIVVSGKKKGDAIAALEADDEAHPDEEE